MNRYKNARIAVARPAPAAVLDFRRCSKAAVGWAAGNTAGAATRHSRRGFACGLGWRRSGRRSRRAPRRNSSAPCASCFPEKGRPAVACDGRGRDCAFFDGDLWVVDVWARECHLFLVAVARGAGPARREFSVLGCSPIPASVTRTLLSWRATPVDMRKRI